MDYGLGSYDDWCFWHRVRHLNGWITAYTNKSEYQHWGAWSLNQLGDRNKRDTENREKFKEIYGEYPEDIWAKKYPKQMAAHYRLGFG